jgi:hypothetical protein
LLLAEATALYRTGAVAEADRAARRIQPSEDAEAATRATFLRGLIADERRDEAGLAIVADTLKAATTPSLEADSAELAARLALRRNDPAVARRQAPRRCATPRCCTHSIGVTPDHASVGRRVQKTFGVGRFLPAAWPLGTGAGLSGIQKCHQPGRKVRDERYK